MRPTLNLVYPDKSDIKYKLIKFPDGQQNIDVDPHSLFLKQSLFHKYNYCNIVSRLNNFSDLEIVICAVKALCILDIKQISLYAPYFLGSRSDRQFEKGGNNYLKEVICPIINSLNLSSITCLDPHSYVLEACLNNFKSKDNSDIVQFAIRDIYGDPIFKEFDNKSILISPDAGALHKIYQASAKIKYAGDIVTCSKERVEGKIVKTNVPYFDLTKDAIIIDDICDGGKTFTEIGKIIKERHEEYDRINVSGQPPHGKLYLIVSHGIFSKGYNELNRYFDGIYCTNSYKDILETEWDGDKKDILTNIKQLNLF